MKNEMSKLKYSKTKQLVYYWKWDFKQIILITN